MILNSVLILLLSSPSPKTRENEEKKVVRMILLDNQRIDAKTI